MQAIIDHGTSAGFDCVAQARELLLELGRKDVASRADLEGTLREAGSHVVAPVRTPFMLRGED